MGGKMKRINMILHIFPQEKFTDNYVLQVNKYFKKEEHLFYIYKTDYEFEIQCLKEENVVLFDNKEKMFLKSYWFKKSSKIIIHGGWSGILVGFDSKFRNLLYKTYIVFWGGDFYNNYKGFNLVNLRLWYKKRRIIKQAAAVINLIEQDYRELAKRYFFRNRHFVGKYFSKEDRIDFERKLLTERKQEKKNEINIIVGNSAIRSNNHFECIDKIALYKDKNIKVYFPLSYGDFAYARQVMKYAIESLGNKCVFLQEFMDIDDYTSLLSKMDVAIFACNRQQAMGNISSLVHMGAKVYMKKNTSMWKYFVDEAGCTIYDIDKISEYRYAEFIGISESIQEKNSICIESIMDIKNKVELWNTIFRDQCSKKSIRFNILNSDLNKEQIKC